jgi:hypothetical protein
LDSSALGNDAVDHVAAKYLFMGKDLPVSSAVTKKKSGNNTKKNTFTDKNPTIELSLKPKKGFGRK